MVAYLFLLTRPPGYITVYSGVGSKPWLIGRSASSVKSRWGSRCLYAHVQSAIPVVLSAGMPGSGLEDRTGTDARVSSTY